MPGYVCTFAGGKGGVGKTTTAVNVGVSLQEMGHDVVVVDADLGMANLGAMLGVDHDESVHEILAGDAAVSDALTEGPSGLTVIAGNRDLEAFAEAEPANLRSVVKTLRNAFEVVLLDTGSGLSHDVAVPLGLADGVVLVTTPDDVAVNDTTKTAQLADRIDSTVIGAVVNRVVFQSHVAAVDERFSSEILAVVPENVEATTAEPLVLEAPDSPAADAFDRFAETLEMLFFDPDIDPEDIVVPFEESWFSDTEDAESGADDGGSDDADSEEAADDEDSKPRFSMTWR